VGGEASRQPAILPEGNVLRNPFVVSVSMRSGPKDVKFGIFATFKIPFRWGIGKRAKHLSLLSIN
jgi:hypothetical protein